VCYPYGIERGAAGFDRFDKALSFAARIHDHRAIRPFIHNQVSVLLKCADSYGLDSHSFITERPADSAASR
jgi:hypothetical protein